MQRHNQVWAVLIIIGWVAIIAAAEYARRHGIDWQQAWQFARIEAVR